MNKTSPARGKSRFFTTQWTRVCRAKADSEEGRRALGDLCDAYYEPVAAFLRSEERNADAARDLTHEFFTHMLGGGAIGTADPNRGRFRSYLLGAVKHFLSHHREAANRKKRGGGAMTASLDDEEAQAVADVHLAAPDKAFDRQWALTLLSRALSDLQDECTAEGKAAMFEKLQPWLTGDSTHGDQTELAEELDLNLNSLKSQIHRLKRRFRELVKAEIAATLEEGDSVEAEMSVLFAVLRKS